MDVSKVVREAVNRLLELPEGPGGCVIATRQGPLPDEISRLLPKYLAWANGDLRKEQKRLFGELLAASYAAKRLFPRTQGLQETYDGLLQLCQFLGIE